MRINATTMKGRRSSTMKTIKFAWLLALLAWLTITTATTAIGEKRLRRQKQRKLEYSDLFVLDKKKGSPESGDMDDGADGDGAEDYYDYSYYYYHEDTHPLPKKSKESSGKMNQKEASGKGSGKGTGTGKGGFYYDYSKGQTFVPKRHPKYHPTTSPPPKETMPPHPMLHEPPRAGGKMGMKREKGKGGKDSSKYDYDDYYYYYGKKKEQTKFPLTKPPSHPTGPTTMPPVSMPTTTPLPPSVIPPPPPVTNPTRLPTQQPMNPNGQDTTAPTTAPISGTTVIELTDFSIDYDISPAIIPPLSEVEAVAAATTTFLRDYFEQQVPGLENLAVNYVGEDLSFPTYTIDYEVVATVSDGTTKEELDAVATRAFQGAKLQEYVELVRSLPDDNSFSRVTGVRKVVTPENRSASDSIGEDGGDGLVGQVPVPLLAAAGAASFALIVLGVTLNRRERAAMRNGNGGKHHHGGDGVTVAGDTYAGDTYDGTTYSHSPSRSVGEGNKSVLSGATYESAVRQIASDESASGYGSDSDAGSKYYEDEEEKVEIEEDNDNMGTSAASISRYGGVFPVDVHDPYMIAIRQSKRDDGGDGDSAGSMHSSIRSGASNHHEQPSYASSGDTTIHILGSAHSRPHSTDSGESSIHILENVSSDDDDLNDRDEAMNLATYRSYYNHSGQVQIPSVERSDNDDYDDLPNQVTTTGTKERDATTPTASSLQQQQQQQQQQASKGSAGSSPACMNSQKSSKLNKSTESHSHHHRQQQEQEQQREQQSETSAKNNRGFSTSVDPPEETMGPTAEDAEDDYTTGHREPRGTNRTGADRGNDDHSIRSTSSNSGTTHQRGKRNVAKLISKFN